MTDVRPPADLPFRPTTTVSSGTPWQLRTDLLHQHRVSAPFTRRSNIRKPSSLHGRALVDFDRVLLALYIWGSYPVARDAKRKIVVAVTAPTSHATQLSTSHGGTGGRKDDHGSSVIVVCTRSAASAEYVVGKKPDHIELGRLPK